MSCSLGSWVIDLSWLAVRRHSGLTGHLVRSHLKTDDVSPLSLLLLIKVTWIGIGFFGTEGGAGKSLLLSLSAESNDRRKSLWGSEVGRK